MSVRIVAPTMESLDALADLWVGLADDQRQYGSHLLAAENRETIREALARHIVTDGLLVAREVPADHPPTERPPADSPLLGFVMFGPEGGAYAQDTRKGVIQNLYVADEARDEGVGSELLVEAEAALRADGCSTVTLDVMARNERAREFYRRHGFRPHRVTMEKGETHMDLSGE